MSGIISWFMLSCFTILFLVENSPARDLVASCDEEHENCKASCIQKYSTPKYDVWNRPRRESDTTRALRDKCKNLCVIGHKECIKRARKREDEENKQEKLEKQVRVKQQEPAESAPPLSSDNKIYQWTDKNGVIHLTNKKEAIPTEYQGQLEQEATKEETKATKSKNNTETKSIDEKTK